LDFSIIKENILTRSISDVYKLIIKFFLTEGFKNSFNYSTESLSLKIKNILIFSFIKLDSNKFLID
jgi:hypothetical protein